jgi:hypothetical protein
LCQESFDAQDPGGAAVDKDNNNNSSHKTVQKFPKISALVMLL